MSHEPMHRIIRLKRYEQPPEGYFEDFLREFHHRQRAELLRPSLGTLLMERIQAILSEIRVPAMAYAGAAAVAVIASVAIVRQPSSAGQPRAYAATYNAPSYSQVPVTIPAMQPVSLRVQPADFNRLDPIYPASYKMKTGPANHESPISF